MRWPRRSIRSIGIVAVCAAAVLAYWWFGLRGMDYETPVELPQSSYGEVLDLDGGFTIHVTADREVLFEGEAVTLDELAARIQEPIGSYEGAPHDPLSLYPTSTQPVLVCVDRRAPFIHAAWVFGLLHDKGINRICVGVRDGCARRALAVPIRSGFWTQDQEDESDEPYRVGEPGILVHLEEAEDGGLLMDAVPERGGEDAKPRAMDFAELEELVRKLQSAIRQRYKTRRTLGVVTGDARLPMQAFVRAFDVLRAAGIEYIEWGIWEAHPWIRHQPRLPIPKHRIAAYAAPGISLNPYLPSLELPVAPGAKRDRNDDRHDRIWIQVGADGGITYRGKRVDLDELAGIVHRAVSAYEFKLRQTGESHPLPDNRPPLIALIRASKDAPWRTVGSVLGLLQERRFRDVQFAVSPVADLRYDRAEAAALGVPWKDRLPPPEGFHESKLPLRLVEDEPAVRLDVRASEDVVTYAVGEYATRDSRALASRIPHGATVGIRADPEVPFKWVVAAVVQCEAAGATAYRFAPPE